MNWLPHVICAGLGLLVTWGLIPIIRQRSAQAAVAGNGADFHHTHKSQISRLGGVALAAAFAVVSLVVLLWFPVDAARTQRRLVIMVGALAMFGLGFCDDLRALGARKKLLGQIVISLVVCYCGVRIEVLQNPLSKEVYELGLWSWVATVFWLVALTNLINLIDGIDGLAGGLALMVMGLLVYVGWGGAAVFPVLVASGMIGALVGFLRYNFPPAKIYMGDGGAYFLGFLIGMLTLVHSQKGTIAAALVAPLFALALPILDVCLAIVRRGLKGLPVFRPDRQHLHHRLQELGLSRTRTVMILYGVSLVFLLMAFGVFWSQGRWVPILFGFLCLMLILSAQAFRFSRDWFAVGRMLEISMELRRETAYALALGRWLELEAERAETVEDLWVDYLFAARKLGLGSVKLTTAEGERSWALTEAIGERWTCVHELKLEGGMRLEFEADKRAMSKGVFDHVSELAAESWLKAATRWRDLWQMPVRFPAAFAPARVLPGSGEQPPSRRRARSASVRRNGSPG